MRKGVPVAQSYGETGTPTGYLLDARGHIASDLAVGPDALLSLLTAVPLVKRWLQHKPPYIGNIKQTTSKS